MIGSHLTDLLVNCGWTVRVLDNLEPQTHRNGAPPWLSAAQKRGVEFISGDICDREIVTRALRDIDVVFHEAAF